MRNHASLWPLSCPRWSALRQAGPAACLFLAALGAAVVAGCNFAPTPGGGDTGPPSTTLPDGPDATDGQGGTGDGGTTNGDGGTGTDGGGDVGPTMPGTDDGGTTDPTTDGDPMMPDGDVTDDGDGPPASFSCAVNSDCPDDGLFCNGVFTCVNTSCVFSDTPCNLAIETCNEQTDACVLDLSRCQSDSNCPINQACDTISGQCISAGVDVSACTLTAGDCALPNGSPGCNFPPCCAEVCSLLPTCCLVAWDDACTELAFTFATACRP